MEDSIKVQLLDCRKLAIGRGLHQKGGFGLGGELALDRDVTPLPQCGGLLGAAEQVRRTPHVVVGKRGLVDEIKAIRQRSSGGGVVGLLLLAGQASDAIALGFQLGEQNLLMTQAIGEELLIERTGLGLVPRKQTACFQYFPPSADHRAAGKGRAIA